MHFLESHQFCCRCYCSCLSFCEVTPVDVLWAERKPRLPAGVGLYYGEEIHGVPPVLLQMVSRTPVLYEVNIFVTNRFVPIPEVMEAERLLVEQLGVSGFYHVIARCGHMPD